MTGGFLYLELDSSIEEYVDDHHIALCTAIRNDITKPLFVKLKYDVGVVRGEAFLYVSIARVELGGEIQYRGALTLSGLSYYVVFHEDGIQLISEEE